MSQFLGNRKPKTHRWLEKQRNDGFVRRAAAQGFRSRAVYKLQEIDQRDRILARGLKVLELGAAPGGWSQYVASRIGNTGQLVAVDLINMDPVQNVHFVLGDFTVPAVQSEIRTLLGGAADLVLSDMAPNITGIRDIDQIRFVELLDSALEFASSVLKPGGSMLMKVFEGSEVKRFRDRCAQAFQKTEVRKPSASRSGSKEYYLLARGLR